MRHLGWALSIAGLALLLGAWPYELLREVDLVRAADRARATGGHYGAEIVYRTHERRIPWPLIALAGAGVTALGIIVLAVRRPEPQEAPHA